MIHGISPLPACKPIRPPSAATLRQPKAAPILFTIESEAVLNNCLTFGRARGPISLFMTVALFNSIRALSASVKSLIALPFNKSAGSIVFARSTP